MRFLIQLNAVPPLLDQSDFYETGDHCEQTILAGFRRGDDWRLVGRVTMDIDVPQPGCRRTGYWIVERIMEFHHRWHRVVFARVHRDNQLSAMAGMAGRSCCRMVDCFTLGTRLSGNSGDVECDNLRFCCHRHFRMGHSFRSIGARGIKRIAKAWSQKLGATVGTSIVDSRHRSGSFKAAALCFKVHRLRLASLLSSSL